MKARILIVCVLCILCLVADGRCAEKQEGWKEFKSHHFIIYYKEAPSDFIRSVNEMAEYYYRDIAENLGFTRQKSWSWEHRAQIYIYDDKEDYITSAQQASWSHGAAALREKIIHTFPSDYGFFDSTLPHELGHIIFWEFVGMRADVPLWLNEGVAMYQEKAKRWGAGKIVAALIANEQFIPLADLHSMRLTHDTPPAIVNLFYAESASVVYYLITELGKYKFVNLCRRLKEGDRFEKALHDTYVRFKDINDLNESWVTYLKRFQ